MLYREWCHCLNNPYYLLNPSVVTTFCGRQATYSVIWYHFGVGYQPGVTWKKPIFISSPLSKMRREWRIRISGANWSRLEHNSPWVIFMSKCTKDGKYLKKMTVKKVFPPKFGRLLFDRFFSLRLGKAHLKFWISISKLCMSYTVFTWGLCVICMGLGAIWQKKVC